AVRMRGGRNRDRSGACRAHDRRAHRQRIARARTVARGASTMIPSSISSLTPRERERLLERIREKRRAPLPVQQPIAIVGMACRFPGASNLDEFWANLRNGVCSISEIPPDRFPVDDWFDPEPAVRGKMNTRWGGFLSCADEFDPAFFGISPDEAR